VVVVWQLYRRHGCWIGQHGCELTIGKPQFAEMEDELRTIHAQAEQLRNELQRLPMKILLYLTG
jgi:Formimidoyltetrahydrofolate cyclodeaminase (EC 4.3.1.4)